MKLWVDAVQSAPNVHEYAWIRSLDMAMFALTLNERKGCPYEGIDIGTIEGNFGDFGSVELLHWLEDNGRNYPVKTHSADPIERKAIEEIVHRNGWEFKDKNEFIFGENAMSKSLYEKYAEESHLQKNTQEALTEEIAFTSARKGSRKFLKAQGYLPEESAPAEKDGLAAAVKACKGFNKALGDRTFDK